jgi:hypothetical protein
MKMVEAGLAPRLPLAEEAAMLRVVDGFDAAVAAYAEGILAWRGRMGRVAKLIASDARMRVAGYLLHLSALDRLAGGAGDVSYGALHALCVERAGEVTPRVLKTTLALLQFGGLVGTSRPNEDRRRKLYRPKPAMLEMARVSYIHAARALDAMAPERQRALRLKQDMDFLLSMLATAGVDHAAEPPASLMPDFMDFVGGREGAGALLAAAMLGDMRHEPLPSREVLARQLLLSKAQVNRLTAEAQARDYLCVDGAGLLKATDLLQDNYRRWVSIELAFMARHM